MAKKKCDEMIAKKVTKKRSKKADEVSLTGSQLAYLPARHHQSHSQTLRYIVYGEGEGDELAEL